MTNRSAVQHRLNPAAKPGQREAAPTLAEIKALVAEHKIHYYIGTNSQSFGGGRGSSAIASWAATHFTKETVGGTTVYDLTKATTS